MEEGTGRPYVGQLSRRCGHEECHSADIRFVPVAATYRRKFVGRTGTMGNELELDTVVLVFG